MSLRVALIVDVTPVPGWIATLARRLTAPAFEVRLYVDDAAQAKPAVYRAYEWVDARIFGEPHDALAPAGDLEPVPVAKLHDCDVAVHLGATDPRGLAGRTRYGAWTLTQSDLFWKMHGGMTYRTTLEAHLPGGECRVLCESRGRPDRTSLRRSRNQAYWKAVGAIARALQRLDDEGNAYLESRPQRPG